MSKKGLIIGTMLVPTIAHEFFIKSCYDFMVSHDGCLDFVLYGRDKEPTNTKSRLEAIKDSIPNYKSESLFLSSVDDNGAPQKDDGTTSFWDYWRNSVYEATGYRNYDYVFASEQYGLKLAETFNAEFIPFDLNRSMTSMFGSTPISGTEVRSDIKKNWQYIMPSFKENLIRSVILFGAESTGKSTMAKLLSNDPDIGGTFVPEWARSYLETVGVDVTEDKMANILNMQRSIEKNIVEFTNGPVIYYDTDILTSVSYSKLYFNRNLFEKTKPIITNPENRLYIVMNSKIPFEPDPQRYGGDKRETSDSHWVDILKDLKQNYYVVESENIEDQYVEIKQVVTEFLTDTLYNPIQNFVRD